MNGWGKRSGVEQVVVGSGSVMQLELYPTQLEHRTPLTGYLGNLLRGS